MQAKAFGLHNSKEVVGKRNHDMPIFRHNKHLAEIIDNHNLQVMRSQNQEMLEFEEYTPYINSEMALFRSYKLPLLNKERQVIGLLGVSYDITKYKQEFEALQHKYTQKELALDNIMANLPGHVYWVDINNRFLGCNDQQAHDFNLKSRHDITGLSVKYSQTRDNAATIIKNNNKVIKDGKIITEEENFKDMHDNDCIYFSRKTPLKDKKGNIVGLLGISLDITDKKRAMAQLVREQSEKAEAEQQLRSVITTYADSIAHNLRTPLAAMSITASNLAELIPAILSIYKEAKENNLASAELLKLKDLDYLTSNAVSNLKSSVSKMNDMIDNNLESLNNAVSIHMGILSEVELLECGIYENLGYNKLELLFSHDNNRKLLHKDIQHNFNYLGNSITMDQILMNIIQNALYQIKQNGKGEIFITTKDAENYNQVIIRDTAGGAKPEVVEKMFDSHFTTKNDGNGVGLDFCKRAMKLFSGDITANSVYGDYMEFTLTLPKITQKIIKKPKIIGMYHDENENTVIKYSDGSTSITPKIDNNVENKNSL
jgi:signal transduction histidine kinase